MDLNCNLLLPLYRGWPDPGEQACAPGHGLNAAAEMGGYRRSSTLNGPSRGVPVQRTAAGVPVQHCHRRASTALPQACQYSTATGVPVQNCHRRAGTELQWAWQYGMLQTCQRGICLQKCAGAVRFHASHPVSPRFPLLPLYEDKPCRWPSRWVIFPPKIFQCTFYTPPIISK